jgi:hypothetical protein
MASEETPIICSFCGKSRAEVRTLIAGPGIQICNGCVTICQGILEKEFRDDGIKKRSRHGHLGSIFTNKQGSGNEGPLGAGKWLERT